MQLFVCGYFGEVGVGCVLAVVLAGVLGHSCLDVCGDKRWFLDLCTR